MELSTPRSSTTDAAIKETRARVRAGELAAGSLASPSMSPPHEGYLETGPLLAEGSERFRLWKLSLMWHCLILRCPAAMV